MTVMLLMPVASPGGGSEQLLLRFLRRSPPDGLECTVVFLENGPLRESLDRQGIATRVVQAGRLREPLRYLRAVRQCARIAEQVDADLVFSWMPKAHLYGSWAAQWAGCPAAWYQHGAPELGWMDRLVTLQPARAVVACSHHVARMQTALWPRRPTHVVHPSVDLNRFAPNHLPAPREARKRIGLPPEGPVVGMVSRLQKWKGVHTFVDAFPNVLEEHPAAHGVIVGGQHPHEPEYDAEIDRRIAEQNLQASISKVGHQSNVPTWMQAMDIVVHASDSEPFGMVVIEAMALGKPVVAGRSGGPSEIIREGRDGLFAPFERPQVLARRLIALLDQPDEAHRMGRAARERAHDFSAHDFSDRLAALLHSFA